MPESLLSAAVELDVVGGGSPGDLLFVPDSRHALESAEDSVVFLTVAKGI
jgi:hypothetical protein